MRFSFVFLFVVISFATSVRAGGVDPTLIYGTRHVGMGGTQIALSQDSYAPFYNPAAMDGVEKGVAALNMSPLVFQYEAPIGSASAQRSGDINFGPLFYMGGVYRLLDRLSFGFGVYPTALQGGKFSNVSYGAGNLANKEWSNRLVRIEFSPSVAIKLLEYVSVGLSYRAGYTRFDKSVGIFQIPQVFAGLHLDSTVSAWDMNGVKVGIAVNQWRGFSFGLTYRYETQIDLKGTTNVSDGSTITPYRTTQEIIIPYQIQAGIAYEWIPDTFLSAFSYEFTNNSVIKNDAPNLESFPLSTVTPLNYRDGHTIHFGSEYVFRPFNNARLRTQIGFAYDRAVTNSAYPNPVLPPPNDYYGYAIGTQYESGVHSYGLALNYGEYSKQVNSIDPTLAAQNAVFTGKYGLKVFMASLDYQIKF